jgi:hypothetical protein
MKGNFSCPGKVVVIPTRAFIMGKTGMPADYAMFPGRKTLLRPQTVRKVEM